MDKKALLMGLFVGVMAQACVPMGDSLPPEFSNEAIGQLRQDLPALILAAALVVIGLGAAALAVFHRSAQGAELFAFGAFSFLYGVRLVAWTPVARLMLDIPPGSWDYVEAVITYFLPVAVFFFLEPFFGNVGWVHWLWRAQLAFAIVATAVDIVTRTPHAAMVPYRVLITIWFLVSLYLMFGRPRGSQPTLHFKVVRAGLLVFVVLAAHATLSGFRPLLGGTSAEPLGLFVFFLSLGYVVVDRLFSNQRQLVAIGQELETAKQIQKTVLPERLPAREGLEIAVRYEPVSAVAGDFYDFIESERGLSVLVADVSGHGVPAALIASMVKVAYSAQTERVEHPAAVLTEVNRILCGKIRGQFVTGACLFFDTRGKSVTYASAGHPPLIRVRPNGGATEEKLQSVLMGFFRAADYQEIELALGAGDKVVLYTDGIVEAMNARGDFFGVERLLTCIQEHAHENAEALAGTVWEYVRSWSGQPFDDDVTLVVIGRV